MSNIFSLNADFRKSLQDEYSFLKLEMILQDELDESNDSTTAEYAIKKVREQCKELFPSFRQIKFRNISPEDKFQYLKFLHYVIRKNCECEKNGFSLFSCLKKPSERYLSLYTNVMSEIKQNVTEPVHLEIEKQHPCNINEESQQDEQKKAYYADSIHSIQQHIDLIASCLLISYYGKPYKELLRDEEFFNICCKSRTNAVLKEKAWTKSLTFWDELYVYLAYARDFYWELDLLASYQKIADATAISPPPEHKYYNMFCPNKRRIEESDYGALILEDGEIKKMAPGDIRIFESPENMNEYLDACEKYVFAHSEEIAKKVFCKADVSKSEKKQICTRFLRVREYYKMERQRYRRNSLLTPSKIISVYQAIFLSLPKSGIVMPDHGMMQAKCGEKLRPQRTSISSAYENSDEKEPLLLQYICVLTVYRQLWNNLPALFADELTKAYFAINIMGLEVILAGGWDFCPTARQLNAELILFCAADTLIPRTLGMDQTFELLSALAKDGWNFRQDNILTDSLISFGKLCRLFGWIYRLEIIEEGLKDFSKSGNKGLWEISLQKASENAFFLHQLILQVGYCESEKCYYLHDFKKILSNN